MKCVIARVAFMALLSVALAADPKSALRRRKLAIQPKDEPAQPTALNGATHSAKAASKGNQTWPFAKPASWNTNRKPRVYFLFMAVDKISNLAVWNAFFKSAPADQYRAFAHCKLPSCVQQVKGSMLAAIPSVPSYYCTDLVSPMQQLLSYSLNKDGKDSNPADKFVYISDSSLPAKPFSEVFATLVNRQGSDFCVFPPAEWADVPGPTGLQMVAKYHQWITLNRAHAEKSWALWSTGYLHNLMKDFKLNMLSWNQVNNSFGDHRNWGCLDEFWFMAALFGTLKNVDVKKSTSLSLAGFEGGPLKIDRTAGWQGQCDTFVNWEKYMHSLGDNKFTKFVSSLDKPSVPHPGNWARPGWWDTLSPAGMTSIRKSDFLFMRKFIDNPTVAGGGDFAATYVDRVLSK